LPLEIGTLILWWQLCSSHWRRRSRRFPLSTCCSLISTPTQRNLSRRITPSIGREVTCSSLNRFYLVLVVFFFWLTFEDKESCKIWMWKEKQRGLNLSSFFSQKWFTIMGPNWLSL
jgi:hypothetical protein